MRGFLLCVLFFFSGELFHPRIAVDLDARRAALKDLIGVETGNDHHGGELEHEGGQTGNGEDDAPYADKVVDEDEFRVAAAADDTRGHGHLVGGTEARHAEDREEIQGQLVGLAQVPIRLLLLPLSPCL